MSPLCCRFVVYNLCLQVRKDFIYCKGTIKNGGMLVGLYKPSLHFSGSKHSRKLIISHNAQVQGERHAKLGG